MDRSIREVRPGVIGLTREIWWTDWTETFDMNVWHNFQPNSEFVTTLERKDGKALDICKGGKALRLTRYELSDLYRGVVDIHPCVKLFSEYSKQDPLWVLKTLGMIRD